MMDIHSKEVKVNRLFMLDSRSVGVGRDSLPKYSEN
jgi:hypothetical protein